MDSAPLRLASDSDSGRQSMSGVRKAAIFLVAIGDELGKKILQNLSEPDVQRLTEELADLRNIPPELSLEVVEEFREMLETQQYMVHGGLDFATRLLVDTFGEQRAEDLLGLVRRAQEATQSDLSMLQRVDPQQLGKFLESEHPQTVAIVLAHLDARKGSIVIDSLSEERRVESIRRLAAMRQFSPEMAQRVAMILHRRLENMGDTRRRSYSGFKAVADLLNRMESEETKKILDEIEAADVPMHSVSVDTTSSSTAVSATSQDGYASGTYQGFSISSAGVIAASFSNGKTQVVGQVALASVANEQGLIISAGNNYQTTTGSGSAKTGLAGTGGLGTLEDDALENSNVDLSTHSRI